MSLTPPIQPGIALTPVDPTTHSALPQQTSAPATLQDPTGSRVASPKHGFREYIKRIASSLQSPDPLRGRLNDLARDYAIFQEEKFEVIDSIVSLYTIDSRLEIRRVVGSQMKFDEVLAILNEEFRQSLESDLSICCLMPTWSKEINTIMPLRSKLFDSVSRISRKVEAPRSSILLAIARQWNLSTALWIPMLGQSNSGKDRLEPAERFIIQGKVPTGASTTPRPPLDDSTWKAHQFRWCSSVPLWIGDFDMYVWQMHVHPPEVEEATLYVHKTTNDHWQLFLAWTHTASQERSRPRVFLQEQLPAIISDCNTQKDGRGRVLSILLSMLILVCDDTLQFRDQCLDRIGKLRYLGRRWPSRQKLNFLLHLDDYREESQRGLREAQDMLQRILQYTGSSTVYSGHEVTQIKDQLKGLDADLGTLRDLLKESRGMIKEQMDLRQFGLSLILTFVAAIYLPFSFIAGMLGMNIKDELWPNRRNSTANNATNGDNSANTNTTKALSALVARATTSLSKSPTPTTSITASELTKALNDALSRPTGHLWTFKQFWWIAVAVTAGTLILPIIAGPTLRSLAQFSKKQRELWRLVVFVAIVVVGLTLALLAGAIGTLILGIPQGLVACFELFWVFVTDKGAKRWIFFTALLTGCLFFDLYAGYFVLSLKGDYYYDPDGPFDYSSGFEPQAGLTGLVPTLWLFFLWVRSGSQLFDEDAINAFFRARHRLPKYLNPVYWMNLRKVDPSASKVHHTINLSVVYAVVAASNISFSFSIYSIIFYLAFSFAGSGFFALYKLVWSVRHKKDRPFWLAFASVVAASQTFYWYTADERIGPGAALYLCAPVFFPVWLLWVRYSWHEIASAWKQIKAQLRRHTPTVHPRV